MLKALKRDYVSHSAISTYQQCPLQYFRYVANLPEELTSSALVFGSGIHRAAELHFEALLTGNTAPSLDELMDAYETIWDQRQDEPIQFGKNETRQSLYEVAKRMLTTFQASDELVSSERDSIMASLILGLWKQQSSSLCAR